MKFALIFFAILVVIGPYSLAKPRVSQSIFQRTFKKLHRAPPSKPLKARIGIEASWIEQKLDNFDDSNTRTWNMRYFANPEYYKSGGPLFIYVGGEWTISPDGIMSGHFIDMAREHSAYLFYTEHRFYGDSHPTEEPSTENLKYLNVRQALADLAHFIRTMKQTVPGAANSKVILSGASYAATMVTWFKVLYPDLANGCWASSAPLFAEVDFKEYKEVMGASIRTVGGEECYNRIQNGFAEMESMMQNNRGAEIKAMLKICDNFDESNDLDLWSMFYLISDNFADSIQYHVNGTIEGVCDRIMSGKNDLDGVIKQVQKYFGERSDCIDLSNEAEIKDLKNVQYSNEKRQWTYQTCSELAWFQTSTSRSQPFGTKYPIDYFTTLCSNAFGDMFTPEYLENQVQETNKLFGGLQPNVENVYFTHGTLDPWSAVGLKDTTRGAFLPLYAHCMDFDSISDFDTAEMRASKERLAQKVREWLQ